MITTYMKYGDSELLRALVSGDIEEFVDDYFEGSLNSPKALMAVPRINLPKVTSYSTSNFLNESVILPSKIPSNYNNLSSSIKEVYMPGSDLSFNGYARINRITIGNVSIGSYPTFNSPVAYNCTGGSGQVASTSKAFWIGQVPVLGTHTAHVGTLTSYSNVMSSVTPVYYRALGLPYVYLSVSPYLHQTPPEHFWSELRYFECDHPFTGITQLYQMRSPYLTSFTLRCSSVLSINALTSQFGTSGALTRSGSKIYVPSTLYNQYITATNWSALEPGIIDSIPGPYYIRDIIKYCTGFPSLQSLANGVYVGISGISLPLESSIATYADIGSPALVTANIDALPQDADFLIIKSSITSLPTLPTSISYFLLSGMNGWTFFSPTRSLEITGYASGLTSLQTFIVNYEIQKNVCIPDNMFKGCVSLKEFTQGSSSVGYLRSTSTSKIGNSSFEDCHELTQPLWLYFATSIGSSAFKNCYSMYAANYPDVTELGISAFQSCSSLFYAEFAKVALIPNYAFAYCTSLEYINCPEATAFGDYAFQSCTSLTKFEWDDVVEYKVTSIGQYCFSGCTALTRVNFPNLELVNVSGFHYCRSLSSIKFPNLHSVGADGFYGCYNVTEVYLPNLLSNEDDSFGDLSSVSSMILPRCKKYAATTYATKLNLLFAPRVTVINIYNGSAVIPENSFIPSVKNFTTSFSKCLCTQPSLVLERLNIGSYTQGSGRLNFTSLRLVSSFTFAEAPMTYLSLPRVKTISSATSSKLRELLAPSLTSLSQNAFKSSTALTGLYLLGTSVVSMQGVAFSQTPIASGTGFIYVPEELVSTYQTATNWSVYSSQFSPMSVEYGFSDICHLAGFSSQFFVTGFSYNGDLVTYPVTSGKAFFTSLGFVALTASTVPSDCEYLYIPSATAPSVSGVTSLKEIYLASSCKALPDNFASGCTSLVSVRDEDSLLSVGSGAFHGCYSLTSIELVELTSVPNNVFKDCSSMTDAFLPKVTSVGTDAFYNCTSLISAVMPRSTSIAVEAFYGCSSLNYSAHPMCDFVDDAGYCAIVIDDSIYRVHKDEWDPLNWMNLPVMKYELEKVVSSLTPVTSLTLRNCSSVPTGIYSSDFSDLWLLGSSVASLSTSTAFDGSLITTTGHIHVWRDVIDQYLVATNWSALASRITVITVHDEIDFDFPKEES